MKTQAQAVVVGGGLIGCSILYFLTKLGWPDVLLERDELTSGSTWHASSCTTEDQARLYQALMDAGKEFGAANARQAAANQAQQESARQQAETVKQANAATAEREANAARVRQENARCAEAERARQAKAQPVRLAKDARA